MENCRNCIHLMKWVYDECYSCALVELTGEWVIENIDTTTCEEWCEPKNDTSIAAPENQPKVEIEWLYGKEAKEAISKLKYKKTILL